MKLDLPDHAKLAGLKVGQRCEAIGALVILILHLSKDDVLVQTHKRGFVSNGELRDLFGPHFDRSWVLNILRDRGLLEPDPEGVFVHDYVEHQDLERRAQTSRNNRLGARRMHEKHGARVGGRGARDSANAQNPVSAFAAETHKHELVQRKEIREEQPPHTPPNTTKPPSIDPQPTPDLQHGDRTLAHDLAIAAITGIPLLAASTASVEAKARRIIEHYPTMTPADHHATVRQILQGRWWDNHDDITPSASLVFSQGTYDTAREHLAQQAANGRTHPTRPLTAQQQALIDNF